ncbi:cysteine hydrolase family protein [Leptothoe sp. LEGE 181152]|nr:cysteine hydrolase family protein [Leptothoe sp. LEGE 181152]
MDPQRTALLLIGFQNDYFAPDGILHGVIDASAKAVKTVENVTRLLYSLENTAVLLISTPICFTPNYEELMEPVGILKTIKDMRAFQEGSKGFESIQALLPFKDKILEVPGKRGFNAFINTDLDGILRKNNIVHLVLAGAVTSICIDSTGRSAHEKGYHVSILKDCTSARTTFEQDFYCENIFPLYSDTITSSEFLEKLAVESLC